GKSPARIRTRRRRRTEQFVPIASSSLGERPGQVVPCGIEVRMYLERPSEEVRRLAVLSDRHVTQALAGQRTEVMRVSVEGLAAVGNGAVVVSGEIANSRSLVPAFGEARRPRDHLRKAGFGFDEISALHGLHAFLEELIHLGDS